MRPHQIFAAMPQDKFDQVMAKLGEESPEAVQNTTVAAAQILKFRPKFLLKQKPAKRAASVRRAMGRTSANDLAEELLAVYFLKCRLELLTEWLDLVGLKHEEGILTQKEIPCPETAELETKVGQFRTADDDDDRTLLLQVFSAQASIDWPPLEAMVSSEA
jgi:hypothetical protein